MNRATSFHIAIQNIIVPPTENSHPYYLKSSHFHSILGEMRFIAESKRKDTGVMELSKLFIYKLPAVRIQKPKSNKCIYRTFMDGATSGLFF